MAQEPTIRTSSETQTGLQPTQTTQLPVNLRIENACLRDTRTVYCARFSRDDTCIATCGMDNIQLWDGKSDNTTELWGFKVFKPFASCKGQHDGMVSELSFAPDGKRLVSCGAKGVICEWDVSTQKNTGRFNKDTDHVLTTCHSPDGETLASGGNDKTVSVWDTKSYTRASTLTGHTDNINRVSFSPSGKRLISSSRDCTSKIWDVATDKCLATLKHETWVNSARFSPNGRHVVTCPDDGQIYIWDAQIGTLLGKAQVHKSGIADLCFAPSGTLLATCGHDGIVKVLDVSWMMEEGMTTIGTTTCKHSVLSLKKPFLGVTFSSDGTRVASCGVEKMTMVWKLADCDPFAQSIAVCSVWQSRERHAI